MIEEWMYEDIIIFTVTLPVKIVSRHILYRMQQKGPLETYERYLL